MTAIVDGALARPDPRERARYIRHACGRDRELRHEVENLLRFEAEETGLLDGSLLDHLPKPAREARKGLGLDRGADRPDEPPLPEEAPEKPILQPGQVVAGYSIERILGQGGMGSVGLALDPELGRRVALKVIRREKASPEMLQRFESERRILARLDHPSIARILGSGTIEATGGTPAALVGLPYFTMEYVEGEPIDLFCDRRCLTIGQRLRLVERVCEALGAAHRNLVVHRDLKPSNVLVCNRDGDAGGVEFEVRLLDFGIAKDLEESAVSNTRTGQQPLTLSNASPEQMRAQAITTAVDVYATGVLLYRLLCGHPPYVLDGDAFENARTICEEAPAPPSRQAMVSLEVWRRGAPVAISPEQLARRRGSDPRRLRRRLRGDLDSIVLKALAKDPGERFGSIEQLAEDLRRHRQGRPVLARGSTSLYRAGKFLHRHRWRLAAAGAVAGLLVAAGAARIQDVRRLKVAEAEAQAAEEQAQAADAEARAADAEAHAAEGQADALVGFLRSLLLAADPNTPGPVTVQDLLVRGQEEVRDALRDQPELLAHQLEAIALAHQSLGNLEASESLLEESLGLRRQVYSPGHRLVARSLNNLAALKYRRGDSASAARLYRQGLEMKERLGQGPLELAKLQNNLAAVLMERGEYGEAERLYRRVLKTRRRAESPDDLRIASSLRNLGVLLYLEGDFTRAEPYLRQAVELRRKSLGPEHTAVASALSSLGRLLHARGHLEESEEVLTEALEIRRQRLGESHLDLARTRRDLASLYFDLGEPATAEILWSRALAVLTSQLPEDNWEIADAESQLGGRLAAQGRYPEAVPCLRDSYRILSQSRGERSLYTRRARERLERLSGTGPRSDDRGRRGT